MGFWKESIEKGKLKNAEVPKIAIEYVEMINAIHALNATVGAKISKIVRASIAAYISFKDEARGEDIFERVQEMIDLSEGMRNDSRLLDFQNYTRYYVSVKFLRDLISRREESKSSADINLAFLNLIKKFLTDSISDSELLELDEQIQQL